MALNPKALLRDEFDLPIVAHAESSPKPPPIVPAPVQNRTTAGQQGFLWREVDPAFSQAVETYHKVYACIVANRMLFSEPQPPSLSENLFIAEKCGQSCQGYLDLISKTEVRMKTVEKANKKFGFLVKDGYATISFFLDSEVERDHWVEIIREAISGLVHELTECALTIPEHHFGSAATVDNVTVDFPHKSGYLKKTSSGSSTFGIKSVKKRWFRLEAGEIRYYEDDDVRASKLKGTLPLQGAKVVAQDSHSTSNIINLLLSSGRNLRLEALSAKEALDWRNAFAETIAILEMQRMSVKPVPKVTRRTNLHERLSVEQKKESVRQSLKLLPPNSPQSQRSRSLSVTFGFGGPGPTSPTPVPSSSGPPSPAPPSSPGPLSRLLSRASLSPTTPNLAQLSSAVPAFKSPAVFDMLKTCLSAHFLLKHMQDLGAVIEAMTERIAYAGEVVIWQGSSGDNFYVVEQGQCEVLKDDVRIAHVFPSKSFGDMALLSNTVRQATIRACQSTRLWCLSRHALRNIATQQEASRLVEKVAFVRQIELFDKLVDSSIEKIAEVMTLRQFSTGDRIIRQGDAGDAFYMILSGRVTVTQQQTFTGPPVELVKLGPGKFFGELALIEDSPRKATVTASTNVACYTLDRQSFLSLFGSMSSAVQESVGIKMLKKVKILEALTDRQLSAISRCLVSKVFAEGEVIIKQGDVGDSFYMIAAGQVSVHVNHVQVAMLEANSFFGEMSLLSNEKRSATVTAMVDTDCLVLSRADFDELLGPLDAIIAAGSRRKSELQERTLRRKSTSEMLMNQLRGLASLSQTAPPGGASPAAASGKRRASAAETNALFANTNNMFELDQLDKLRRLSSGTFSTVYLVQHYFTTKNYAMKVLHKERLLETDQEASCLNEKEALLSLVDSPYAPALYATLQDEKSLYLVQQYVPGGDLWTLLYGNKLGQSKSGGLPSHAALFYATNALAALQHMHNADVIHRDLKPENLMVDTNGYLKVVDYGCAKVLPLSEKTRTLCGCSDYLSPEMIFAKAYNRSVDFWQLGVLIFELMTRSTPFTHTNMAMLFQNIIDCEEGVKTYFATALQFDANARSTISALLTSNPSTRLGMLHEGVKDVWTSPFFKGVSMELAEKRKMSAPYVPSSEDGGGTGNLADTLENIVVPLDEPDEAPTYTGAFNYSQF